MPRKLGFTLAELLIAIVILGVVATFVIPKILSSQKDAKRLAIMKEAISTVAALSQQGIQNGQLSSNNARTYFLPRINGIKVCEDTPIARGCWGTSQNPTIDDWRSVHVLQSGAQIAGFHNGSPTNPYESFIVDWNGPTGPNVEGDDQIFLAINFIQSGGMPAGWTGPSKPGTIGPLWNSPTSTAFYQQIFN